MPNFERCSYFRRSYFCHLPLVTHFGLIIVLNPRNLPYYVTFWTTPLPPLERDVIYGWSLIPNSVISLSVIVVSLFRLYWFPLYLIPLCHFLLYQIPLHQIPLYQFPLYHNPSCRLGLGASCFNSLWQLDFNL